MRKETALPVCLPTYLATLYLQRKRRARVILAITNPRKSKKKTSDSLARFLANITVNLEENTRKSTSQIAKELELDEFDKITPNGRIQKKPPNQKGANQI